MWNQLFPERASTIAGEVDLIMSAVTALALIFAVPIAFLVIFFAIRYRRNVPRERYVDTHEGRGRLQTWILETAWIVIPLILALSIFAWGASIYYKIYAMPGTGMDIYVVGKQWMWKFQHPTGQTEIDELHVPVNFPVRLTMISEDVIHSFYVPAFRVKRDVIPGEYTTVWFEATKTGTYDLYCAEYCGADHSRMRARVIVMDATAYQQWLSQRSVGGGTSVIPEDRTPGDVQGQEATPGTMADAGAQLFTNLGCNSCHREDGGGAGPSLVGRWGQTVELENGETRTVDIDYVRRSILDPQAEIVAGYPPIMPTYDGQISEDELLTLVEYIRSLSDGETAGEGAETGDSGEMDNSEVPDSGEGDAAPARSSGEGEAAENDSSESDTTSGTNESSNTEQEEEQE